MRLFIICRYYKNSISQEEGWNKVVISWYQRGTASKSKTRRNWGRLVLDEMKIQVYGTFTLQVPPSIGNIRDTLKIC